MDELRKLFESADLDSKVLTEDFLSQVSTLFETAVEVKTKQKTVDLEENLVSESKKELTEFKDTLLDQIDVYLDEVVKEYFEKNENSVVAETKAEMLTKLVTEMKGVFEKNGIKVDNETDTRVERLSEEVESLREEVNKKTNLLKEQEKQGLKASLLSVFEEETKDLSKLEVTNLKSLIEDFEITNTKQFKQKLQIIKSNFLNEDISNFDKDKKTPTESTDRRAAKRWSKHL